MKPAVALVVALALVPAPVLARSSSSHSYANAFGRQTKAPRRSLFSFLGAKAKCRDGSHSYSRHRSGSCSGHGGVKSF